MAKYQKLIIGLLLALPVSCVRADAVFDIWVEAPSEVQAGETFTAPVWAEVSGSILDDSDGRFSDSRLTYLPLGLRPSFQLRPSHL